jgi:hypothetical protein
MDSMGLSKEAILKALQDLSDGLAAQNVRGELCLFGGTVMVLAFAARLSTKDVDAVFQPTQTIRNLAESIGEANQLPKGWLNDGVKGFLSVKHDVIQGNLPQFPNLRLTMPAPEYLLAMKCMASRINTSETGGGDVPDIVFLIRRLNLKSARAVMDIVAEYYPANQVPIKAQYLVESLFEEGKI